LAAGNWLFYGTGGGAFGDVRANVTGFGDQTIGRAGWAAGAGVEVGLTRSISMKAEYIHVDLGSAVCDLGHCSNLTNAEVKFRAETLRVGLNWRFF